MSITIRRTRRCFIAAAAAFLMLALAACTLSGQGGKEPNQVQPDRGAPGADLTVGPVYWGMNLDDALQMLAATEGDGDVVGHDGKITMAAEFCACPAEISWCFADDGNGYFLNSIEVLFTDEEAFDREAVAKALEEIWGQRCKYERGRKYSPGVDGPNIAPKEDWYWRTEDFSDEYQWKSGVTARFTTSEAVYMLRDYLGNTSPEPAGAPLLRIDATGRNQAEGRLTSLPKTEETKWEVCRLMGLAALLRPSAESWEYYDPTYMRPEPGEVTESIRIHTPEDLALAEKLFAPYSAWLTLDYRGDQYRETDVSDYVLDGSLTPTADIVSREDIYGISAVLTNRTDGDLTLYLPMGILAERGGQWVWPEHYDEGMPDWSSPTLAPGESYMLICDYATRHSCYDFVPGRYMLTVGAQGEETDGVVYGALIEITEGPAPEAGEVFIPFESGGYILSVPVEYADKLTVETERKSEDREILFTVTEKASYEAGQKLSPGNEDGLGWLFSIGRVSEDELGKLMMWDMSGVRCFAREEMGDYLLLLQPTDVRFVPTDASPAWQEQWEALSDWACGPMTERFLVDSNRSLTPCRHGDTFVENVLARVLYYDPAEYGEAAPALIQCGDGEGLDPLGTDAAQDDARKLLWGYGFEGAATAADFPKTGMTVTVTDPLGCELTFREGSDVVAVANVSTDIRYLRMVPATQEMKGRNIGSAACQWYFDAAAVLSGETVTFKNGSYTLRLPAEYADRLCVETPEGTDDPGKETLFRVSEKASRDRWDESGRQGNETDGWFFSILRVKRDDWGRWITGGDSGVFIFAQDEEGYCYLYSYPIWLTFCPEEETPALEGEAYRRYRTLYTAASRFDAEGYFTADNGLQPCRFTDMQHFLCFAAYGYENDHTVGRVDGERYDPKANALSAELLKRLIWETDYEEEAAIDHLAVLFDTADAIMLARSGGESAVFWPGSEQVFLSSGDRWRIFLARSGDAPAGDLALELLNAAQTAALPERSGRTVSYENRGVTLTLPEEYAPYLIVETPEEGDAEWDILFRVSQRSSWENGQKMHPGEDRGDGLLFILRRYDEEQLLWELRAHPTPAEFAAKDAEGGYYILGYPSDVRYVGDGDVIITNEQGWKEWEAWCRWSRGLASEGAITGPGLTSFHKSFSHLESALAAFLTGLDEYVELRFLDGDGREIDPASAPDGEAIARQLLMEYSSYDSPDRGPSGDGQVIRMVFHLPTRELQPVTVTFREGSTVFEETVDYGRGQSVSRCVRVSFAGAGQTVGDLMVKWYREAAEGS